MKITDPNHYSYDGIKAEDGNSFVITMLDDDTFSNFSDWRKENPKAEIINMDISVVSAERMKLSDGAKYLTPINAIVMQIKDPAEGKSISMPDGDLEWDDDVD